MIKTILIALTAGIIGGTPLPTTHPVHARASAAIDDLITVLPFFPDARREHLARIGHVFAGREASWYADPPGDNDAGSACGVMQVHTPHLFIEGATCAKVRADRKLGFRVGLVIIDRKWTECGTLAAALTAYATSGACPAKGWVLPLVRQRCKLAGLTSDCK